MISAFRSRRHFASILRAALIGLTILALAWQSYLSTAHSHASATAIHNTAVGTSNLYQVERHERQPAGTPDSCPICQSLATAGTPLPSAAIHLFKPSHIAAWYGLPVQWASVPQQRSHGWHSRGPPTA